MPSVLRAMCASTLRSTSWTSFPAPLVPAGAIEGFVVDQIKAIGRDPAVVAATFREAGRQMEEAIRGLVANRDRLLAPPDAINAENRLHFTALVGATDASCDDRLATSVDSGIGEQRSVLGNRESRRDGPIEAQGKATRAQRALP